jgi:sulfonate transport system substrate-binding protein
LVKALERAGLTLKDVEPVFLPPADANAALSAGLVDGWFIWEPFPTRAVQSQIGRVLLDGGSLRDTGNFYTTRRAFLEEHPEALKLLLRDAQQAEAWCRDHPQELAELLAPTLLMDVPTLLAMHDKYTFGVLPISEQVIAKQQQVADLWLELGFLPHAVDVKRGFLSPEQYIGWVPPLAPQAP